MTRYITKRHRQRILEVCFFLHDHNGLENPINFLTTWNGLNTWARLFPLVILDFCRVNMFTLLFSFFVVFFWQCNLRLFHLYHSSQNYGHREVGRASWKPVNISYNVAATPIRHMVRQEPEGSWTWTQWPYSWEALWSCWHKPLHCLTVCALFQ